MAGPDVVVDRIADLAAAPERDAAGKAERGWPALGVAFAGGETALLDLNDPRAEAWNEVLASLRRFDEPAYVEVDPDTRTVTNLLAPVEYTVEEVKQAEASDAVEVTLGVSHARHFLRRETRGFQRLRATLQAAQKDGSSVLVTETLAEHEIIDARPVKARPRATVAEAAEGGPATVITPQRAQELFNLVNDRACCPCSAADPCIPFLYPDDGCWGRAHEMGRLIEAAGVTPAKVWIYGNLCAPTRNHPACEVHWGWHVAPTVLVNGGGGNQYHVIDPSLFNNPVTEATWKGAQGDPAAQLVDSDGAVFYRSRTGGVQYDPTYAETRRVLETYRRQLVLRSVGPDGPPPYAQCMARPAGTQWFGSIAANATARWFTWGWPADWHIVWTIMPLTQCRGAAQLTWSVQVERANATQCTYWITVRNLTGAAVKFEGRYDILKR